MHLHIRAKNQDFEILDSRPHFPFNKKRKYVDKRIKVDYNNDSFELFNPQFEKKEVVNTMKNS